MGGRLAYIYKPTPVKASPSAVLESYNGGRERNRMQLRVTRPDGVNLEIGYPLHQLL